MKKQKSKKKVIKKNIILKTTVVEEVYEEGVSLKPTQLSRRWGIGTGTLANWRVIGKGPKFWRPGGRDIRYRLEEVLKYELEKEQSSTSEG